MKTSTITITLKSDLLPGSSGGFGNSIDKDIVFDRVGVPYIPTRRVKGLLRDSLKEALLIANLANITSVKIDDTLNKIFGKTGSNSFPDLEFLTDLYPQGYSVLPADYTSPVPAVKAKEYFSYTRSLTAIEANTGVAKETSLRRFRLLKHYLPDGKEQCFVGKVAFPEEHLPYVQLACKNLTRMGTSRNRGLGNIMVSIDEENAKTLFEKIKKTEVPTQTKQADDSITIKVDVNDINPEVKEDVSQKDDSTYYLPVQIATLQNVLIRTHGSDENMAETLNYLRGTNIMGLMAQFLLIKKSYNENEFFRLFLRGGLKFSDALPYASDNSKFTVPVPGLSVIEENKITFKDSFCKKEQAFLCYNSTNADILEVKTSATLHHTRNRNNGQVDTVFNYRAISAGQTFKTTITGNKTDLELLKELFKDTEYVKIGSSQTAEYGSCKITLGDITEYKTDSLKVLTVTNDSSKKYIMVLLSDTIVYNTNGFPTLNHAEIETILNSGVTDDAKKVQIESVSKVKAMHIENYIKVWKSKKPSETAFRAGTSFLLNKLPENYETLLKNGLGERTSEGFGQIAFIEEGKVLNINTKSSTALENELLNKINSWAKIEEAKKANETHASEWAKEFASAKHGSFARQLVTVFERTTELNFTSVINSLSPKAKDKLMHTYARSTNLYDFITKLNDVFSTKEKYKEYFKQECDFDDETLKKLKKHYISSFLMLWHLENKLKGLGENNKNPENHA